MSQFSGQMSQYHGFRGRGRGGLRTQAAPAPRDLPPPLGITVNTIILDEIHGDSCSRDDAKITGCEYVASYNIQEPKTSIIFVPGTPPRWTPPRNPAALTEDRGEYYRDDNAARFPRYPMEPAVRAVFASDPHFNCDAIDIVACASTLGSLMCFALGSHLGFCFTVHIVGKTAFFLRREASPKAIIEGVRGYGHTFPEAYTTWDADVKRSVLHQRIIKYRLGSKNIMLRFKADGYIEEPNEMKRQEVSEEQEYSIEDHFSEFNPGAKKLEDADLAISVHHAGRVIPQAALFDLKTRSCYKKSQDVLADELPRLWVRQISKFILAFHNTGVFDDIKVEDIGGKSKSWEKKNEKKIRKLVEVLEKVVDTAMAVPNRKVEVRSTGQDPGRLELRNVTQDGSSCSLPQDLERLWIRNGPVGGEYDRYDSDEDEFNNVGSSSSINSDDDLDYTACSAESCGYCGKCPY